MIGFLGASLASAAAADLAAERAEMVRHIELEALMISAETGIAELDPRVLDAMRQVRRDAFVPEELRAYAHRPHPLPVGYDQNLAAPLLAALMTHLAEVEDGDVAFETGT